MDLMDLIGPKTHFSCTNLVDNPAQENKYENQLSLTNLTLFINPSSTS